MSVIGLDIGTTGCKAIVFGREWEILGRAAREYPVLTPHVDGAEQDAEQVWHLAMDALAQTVEGSHRRNIAGGEGSPIATSRDWEPEPDQAKADPPRAMALSVQGEAVIPVDKAGRVPKRISSRLGSLVLCVTPSSAWTPDRPLRMPGWRRHSIGFPNATYRVWWGSQSRTSAIGDPGPYPGALPSHRHAHAHHQHDHQGDPKRDASRLGTLRACVRVASRSTGTSCRGYTWP